MKNSLLLTVTNRCNLNCIYCYETHKDGARMSLDTAQNIIKAEINENEYPKMIEFHGGEPLMNFVLIKQIFEWYTEKYPEAETKFFLTTNGVLLDKEKQKWFRKHKDVFAIALSLDGTPAMNKTNRGCEIRDDVLGFIHECWPFQTVKMTISPHTIGCIGEGVVYAHSKGFPISANLAYGVDWIEGNYLEQYKKELDKLVQYYTVNPEIEPCSLLELRKLTKVLLPYSLDRHCQAGKTFKAYDVDGSCFPCHVFSPNTLEAQRWNEVRDTDFKDDSRFDDAECRDCAIHNICGTCYGMNYIQRGDVGKRDKSMCVFVKAEKRAAAQLAVNRVTSKPFDKITEQEYALLKAAKKILDIAD